MQDAQLQRLIPSYRRNSDETNGAVRVSSIETIVMEQMPGGKFQIYARTNGGDGAFVSKPQSNLGFGQAMLETMRQFLGGELEDQDSPNVPSASVLDARPQVKSVAPAEDGDDFMRG